MLKYIFLLLPFWGVSQNEIPKKANTIELQGVFFKEIANGLLDAGYTFEKVDSNFYTIRTEFKNGTGKNKWMKCRLLIRVKDSTAIISGEWYNSMFIGSKILGQEQTIENSTYKIEYTSGNSKNSFVDMKTFAEFFKRPIRYLTK